MMRTSAPLRWKICCSPLPFLHLISPRNPSNPLTRIPRPLTKTSRWPPFCHRPYSLLCLLNNSLILLLNFLLLIQPLNRLLNSPMNLTSLIFPLNNPIFRLNNLANLLNLPLRTHLSSVLKDSSPQSNLLWNHLPAKHLPNCPMIFLLRAPENLLCQHLSPENPVLLSPYLPHHILVTPNNPEEIETTHELKRKSSSSELSTPTSERKKGRNRSRKLKFRVRMFIRSRRSKTSGIGKKFHLRKWRNIFSCSRYKTESWFF